MCRGVPFSEVHSAVFSDSNGRKGGNFSVVLTKLSSRLPFSALVHEKSEVTDCLNDFRFEGGADLELYLSCVLGIGFEFGFTTPQSVVSR